MFFRLTAAFSANHENQRNPPEHTTPVERVDRFALNVTAAAKEAIYKKRLARNIDPTGRSFPLYQYITLAKYSAELTGHPWFGNFVMVCIAMAGILVGLQTYPYFESNPVLNMMDTIILAVFTFEILVKVVAEGMQPELYFIGPSWKWNLFDFIIVLFSLPLIPGMDGNVSFLRLIRLLRLGKVFRKVPQLQMIMMGLVGGMKSIFYIVVLLFLVFYLYAIVGIFFFRMNDPWHFRSVEISLLTMLSVASFEGWANIFYINYFGCKEYPGDNYVTTIEERESNKLGAAMLCTHPQAQPVLSIFFFISFIFICSFSMLSLFVGTVTVSMSDAMAAARDKRRAKAMKKKLIDAEKKMIAMQLGRNKLDFRMRRRLIILEKAFVGDDIDCEIVDDETVSNVFLQFYKVLAVKCQKISVSPYFTSFVTFVIILAGVVVGIRTDDYIAANFKDGLFWLEFLIQAIFTIECCVLIVAEEFTPWKYFDNNWNKFDFVVVVGSYFNVGGSMIILLRLLRLLRVLKLMKALPRLQVIVTALMNGGSSFLFIFILLFLFYYFAGIIAMILFRKNDPHNFGTLHITILTLFQCTTFDDWIDVMYVTLYGCDITGYDDFPEECTDPYPQFAVGALYFVLLIVIGALVLLTLFIGVVTTGMEQAELERREAVEIEKKTIRVAKESGITPHLVERYKEVFEMIDLNGGNTIEMGELKLGMKAAGRNMTDANLFVLWRQVDRDCSGEIDFSEFLTFMLNLRKEGDSRRSVKGVQFNRDPPKLLKLESYESSSTMCNSTKLAESSSEKLIHVEGTAVKPDSRGNENVISVDNCPVGQLSVDAESPSVSDYPEGIRSSPNPSKPPSRLASRQESVQGELDTDYNPALKPKPTKKLPCVKVAPAKVAQERSLGNDWLRDEYGAANPIEEADDIKYINNNVPVDAGAHGKLYKGFGVTDAEVPLRLLRSSKSHWHNDGGDNTAEEEDERQRQYDERSQVHRSLKLALQARHKSFENDSNTLSSTEGSAPTYNRADSSTLSGKGPGGVRRVISKICYI